MRTEKYCAIQFGDGRFIIQAKQNLFFRLVSNPEIQKKTCFHWILGNGDNVNTKIKQKNPKKTYIQNRQFTTKCSAININRVLTLFR